MTRLGKGVGLRGVCNISSGSGSVIRIGIGIGIGIAIGLVESRVRIRGGGRGTLVPERVEVDYFISESLLEVGIHGFCC